MLFYRNFPFTISVLHSNPFILFSLINSSIKNRKENYFLKDRMNIFLLSAGLLIIISALIQSFGKQNLNVYNYDLSLTWLGLFNWLPFFWLYWAVKPFLKTPEKRKRCCVLLLTGTTPVILTGLGQVFFNWHGPLSTLNGVIIWYQRPIEIVKGLTGLFNNPNYAGAWLNIVWPFALALLIELRKETFKKIAAFLFIFGLSLSIVLTYSRSAWLGIFSGSVLVFGKKVLILLKLFQY